MNIHSYPPDVFSLPVQHADIPARSTPVALEASDCESYMAPVVTHKTLRDMPLSLPKPAPGFLLVWGLVCRLYPITKAKFPRINLSAALREHPVRSMKSFLVPLKMCPFSWVKRWIVLSVRFRVRPSGPHSSGEVRSGKYHPLADLQAPLSRTSKLPLLTFLIRSKSAFVPLKVSPVL